MAVREAEAFRSGRRAGVLGKVGNGGLQRKYGVAKGDEMKVRAGARTGTKSRKQERCRMGNREGIREAEGEPDVPKRKRRMGRPEYRPRRMEIDLKQVKVVRERDRNHRPRPRDTGGGKRKERGEDGKPPTSSGSDSGPRPRKPKPERELENCHVVEFGLGSEAAQAGTGRKEGMWKETKDVRSRSCCNFGAVAEMSAKTTDTPDEVQQAATRPKDLGREHGLETRRLVEGKMNAKSSKVGSEVGSGEMREEVCKVVQSRLGSRLGRDPRGGSGRADGMEEAARGMGNRNNEKGRNRREMHGEDPMGRTPRRKSSTCSETTNSESTSRRFGSEESEVGRCVRNRKSSAESVVGIRNPEMGSRIRNDKGEDRRMTAQEVLVQSESANNSSEEKSEIIGKARKFEMPIPPLRVDVPSSSARFQLLRGSRMNGKPDYSGLLDRMEPKGPTGERREARRARDSTAGEKRLPDMRGSKGAEASDEVPEEPKHLTNQSRKATGKTEANARMFGRVPVARAAEEEHDRGGIAERRESGRRCWMMENTAEVEEAEKAMKPKLQGVPNGTRSRWKISERKRRPDLSSEHENGKETANGGEQPRTTPDASAEASIGRSEVTNGRLESEPRKGDEQRTEVQGTKMPMAGAEATRNAEMKDVGIERVPERKAKKNECRRGMDVGEWKLLGGMDREVGRDSEAKQRRTTERLKRVQDRVRNGPESSEGKETRKEQREEVATGSTGAEQELKSSAERMTQAQMVRTRVGGWNVHEARETRRWTEQSSEGVVEPWEVSARGSDRSSEDPNKSREVEQLGRAGRNGQTELRNDAADLYSDMRWVQSGNATYELQQHTRGVRNQSRAKTESSERKCAERARGVVTENTGGADRKPEVSLTMLRRLDGTVGDVGRRDDRSPEDADKMSGGGTVRKQEPKGRTELRSDAARMHNTRGMSGTKGTETECPEGNFAKSCEENRRRAPKIAGGANRGLEGSTERDSRLKRSLGDARPKGDRNPEEPEEGQKGADRTAGSDRTRILTQRSLGVERPKGEPSPEEPEEDRGYGRDLVKTSGTLARMSEIRSDRNRSREHPSVTGRAKTRFGLVSERDGSRAGVEFPDGQPCEGEPNRRIPSLSRAPTERIGDEPKRPDQPEGSGRSPREKARKEWKRRTSRTEPGEPDGSERNRGNPMVRNKLQKSEGRGEEPREFGDKTSEVSEMTEMEERKCQGIRDPKSVPENKSG
ncbi:hypothetical protein DFH06DRAFT_1152757 [Mycena polygramma]|nr:hypothetical protein DFH06DRAFT_1152757 [Mycena polygramma]